MSIYYWTNTLKVSIQVCSFQRCFDYEHWYWNLSIHILYLERRFMIENTYWNSSFQVCCCCFKRWYEVENEKLKVNIHTCCLERRFMTEKYLESEHSDLPFERRSCFTTKADRWCELTSDRWNPWSWKVTRNTASSFKRVSSMLRCRKGGVDSDWNCWPALGCSSISGAHARTHSHTYARASTRTGRKSLVCAHI